MTKSTPTPGPWAAIRTDTDQIDIAAEGRRIAYIQPTLGRGLSATITDEDVANAVLIAASLTLYEFVAKKALEGDADAARIIANI